jgi:dynactin 1
MSEFRIGQTVETSTQQQGLVKYVGPIHVAEGDWLGIELPTATGKNDGSVRGERYFTCPAGHGLFIREANIIRIVAQPAPKHTAAPAPAKPKAISATASKPRPSSVTAQKPTSRPSSVITPKPAPRATTAKRQSVVPATVSTSRAITRRTSTASASDAKSKVDQPASRTSNATSSTSTANARPSRDPALETLQTKVRHLEKQRTEDQELVKELSQARDERDRFKGIIEKLQTKYQILHQDAAESKAQLQHLEAENDKFSKAHEEHEADWEIALLDKEMAEERAEQAESELETLRSKMEERDMELEILREEAEMFTTDLSEDQKEEAGYYRLQHENDRLRQALIAIKEMTEEKERDNKARFSELESDLSTLEAIRQENVELRDRVQKTEHILEHLRAQVDANAEWEDVSNELTIKNQDLEDTVASQEATVRELESLKELTDELLQQQTEHTEDLLIENAAKDSELAEQAQRIIEQEAVIADHQTLNSKFRDLVFDLQTKMADAESSRNMTEAQVKDTTGRFNEVMDLNRRLRASNVQATSKEITSELRRIHGDEATEKLAICTEAESTDFGNSEPLRAYFTSKSIAAKASLIASLLANTDRQLSYNGGLDEASARLLCVEAIYYLNVLEASSNWLWSAMSAAPLSDFTTYGSVYGEVVTVEKALDQGLEALKADEVNFGDLGGSFERSTKIQDAIVASRQVALAALPEEEALTRVRKISAGLDYLDSNLAVVSTMLRFLANHGDELLDDSDTQLTSSAEVMADAVDVHQKFSISSAKCTKAMLAGQKLLKTVVALRKDGLYPHFLAGLEDLALLEDQLQRTAREASKWGQNALRVVSSSFDEDGKFHKMELDLFQLCRFYWSAELDGLDTTISQLHAWTEDASLLLNTSEIVHGPTPWSQKAKEVEVDRKKNSEASILLENLKAEHKATLLSLHERERVIETKSLEIEHLDAKYRDATSKATDAQQLRDKLARTEQEFAELQQQLHKQEMKMEQLEQHVAQTDASDHGHVVEHVANTPREPVEHPVASSQPLPAQLKCLVDALETENHWLRKREHANLFHHNLEHVFGKLRRVPRHRSRSGDVALAGILLDEDDLEVPMSETSTHGSKRKALEQHDEEVFTPQVSNMRPKMSPLGLAATQTGWQPYGATPIADFAYWEKNLIQVERRKDLKVIFKEDEDVPWDEGDSSDFESLSGEMGF